MSDSSDEQRRLGPLDREDLVSLLRSKPVSEWEKAVQILTKLNLLFLPRDSYEGLGIKRPAMTPEVKAARQINHLKRCADQQLASEARKERRRLAHEKRTADQKAAANRKSERIAEHRRLTVQAKEAAALRRGPKTSAKTILADYREAVKENLAGMDPKESEATRTWLMTLPEHYRGRATGPRWVARAPFGKDKEWFYRDIEGEALEVAETAIQNITLLYNATNHKLSIHFHERTGFAPGPQGKGKGEANKSENEEDRLKKIKLRERELRELIKVAETPSGPVL